MPPEWQMADLGL